MSSNKLWTQGEKSEQPSSPCSTFNGELTLNLGELTISNYTLRV